jgi:hypothetical protein
LLNLHELPVASLVEIHKPSLISQPLAYGPRPQKRFLEFSVDQYRSSLAPRLLVRPRRLTQGEQALLSKRLLETLRIETMDFFGTREAGNAQL